MPANPITPSSSSREGAFAGAASGIQHTMPPKASVFVYALNNGEALPLLALDPRHRDAPRGAHGSRMTIFP